MGRDTYRCPVVSRSPGLISPSQQVWLPQSETTSDPELSLALIHLRKSKTTADQAVGAVNISLAKVLFELLQGN